MPMPHTWKLLLLLLLLLPGCSFNQLASLATTVASTGTPPIVRADQSATAAMTLIACPLRPDGQAALTELITTLSQQSPIVTASDAGTARLTLNLCPSPISPEAIRAASEAARARR